MNIFAIITRAMSLVPIAVLVLTSGSAFAASEQDDAVIEEIVVTATHRETQLMDTPVAVSAVDGAFIESIGAVNMEGVFKHIAGLNMNEGVPASFNQYQVRGISSLTGGVAFAQTYSAISVYLDNVPVTSAQGPSRQFGGNLFDIERVEVLKGPQGTLFGEGSVGGTIRYIHRKPEFDRTTFKVRGGFFGIDESGDEGSRLEAVVNFPIGDNAAVRLMGYSNDQPGWMDKSDRGEKDTNSVDMGGGRIAVLWAPTELLSLEGSVYRAETTNSGAMLGTKRYDEDVAIRIPGLPPMSEEEMDIYSLNLEYEFDWATWHIFGSYMDRESNAMFEFPQSFASLFDWLIQFNVAIDSDPTRLFAMLGEGWQFTAFSPCSITCVANQSAFNNSSTAESERTVFETRLVSNADSRVLWTAGFFYKDSDDYREDRQPFRLFPFLDNATVTHSVYEEFFAGPENVHLDNYQEFSLYGEVTFPLLDTVELTVGARYTDMEQKLEESSINTTDEVWSPKGGIAWRPVDNTLLFLNVSTGFRPGNLNLGQEFNRRQLSLAGDAVLPNVPPFTANPDMLTGNQAAALAESLIRYDGDEVINYDVGWKSTFLNDRLDLVVSAHYLDWEDTILTFQQQNLPVFTKDYNANAGAAHSTGLELEIVYRPIDQLTLRLVGDINEAELDEDFGAVEKGAELPYAPEYSAALTVDYEMPIARGLSAGTQLNYTTVGKQKTALNEDTYRLPKRNQLDARVSLRNPEERWLITLFVNNLTNEDSVTLDNSTAVPLATSQAYQRPRFYGIEFNYEFEKN